MHDRVMGRHGGGGWEKGVIVGFPRDSREESDHGNDRGASTETTSGSDCILGTLDNERTKIDYRIN